MKRSHLISATVAIALLIAPVVLATVTDCMALIDALKVNTAAATFYGQNAAKDEAGLLGRLSDANVKLNEGKFADAVQKLNDYVSKVNQLISAGKIDAAQGTSLITDANAAITCIQSLGQ